MIGCFAAGWLGVCKSRHNDEATRATPVPPSGSHLQVGAVRKVETSDVTSHPTVDDEVDARWCNLLKSFLECAMPLAGFGLCVTGVLVSGGFIVINLPWIAPAMITAGVALLFIYIVLDICDKTSEARDRLNHQATLAKRNQLPTIAEEGPSKSDSDTA